MSIYDVLNGGKSIGTRSTNVVLIFIYRHGVKGNLNDTLKALHVVKTNPAIHLDGFNCWPTTRFWSFPMGKGLRCFRQLHVSRDICTSQLYLLSAARNPGRRHASPQQPSPNDAGLYHNSLKEKKRNTGLHHSWWILISLLIDTVFTPRKAGHYILFEIPLRQYCKFGLYINIIYRQDKLYGKFFKLFLGEQLL